jgi:hypothetical protein
MWKQWTNLILSIILVAMAYYGVAVEWIMAVVILIALVAFLSAFDEAPTSTGSANRAHWSLMGPSNARPQKIS